MKRNLISDFVTSAQEISNGVPSEEEIIALSVQLVNRKENLELMKSDLSKKLIQLGKASENLEEKLSEIETKASKITSV